MKNLIERTRSNTEIIKKHDTSIGQRFTARTHDDEYNSVLEIHLRVIGGFYRIAAVYESNDWYNEEKNIDAIKSIVEFLLIEHAIKDGY